MRAITLFVLPLLLLAGCGEEIQNKVEQAKAKDDPSVPLLIPCEACKEGVAKKTDKCPKCGHPTADSVVAYKKGFTIPALNLEMIWVQPGTFTMGSPTTEAGRDKGETQRKVTLTNGFYLGKYEVTQSQYKAVMNENPSEFVGDNRPVEMVSWNKAIEFCDKLTEIQRKASMLPKGMVYTLPTEAQWEYACRAGTTTAYSWGNRSVQAMHNWD